ncbi:hypothetical protein SUDANB176_07692 (plasmid) [Streptomyces sp. enrichment culture]
MLASAASHRAFAHQALADGDEVDLGGLTLRALATPGHTDEHLSFLLLDRARELGVFTGGSLIVNSPARIGPLGPERTEELARAQYHSLKRLTELPQAPAAAGRTPVYLPTEQLLIMTKHRRGSGSRRDGCASAAVRRQR